MATGCNEGIGNKAVFWTQSWFLRVPTVGPELRAAFLSSLQRCESICPSLGLHNACVCLSDFSLFFFFFFSSLFATDVSGIKTVFLFAWNLARVIFEQHTGTKQHKYPIKPFLDYRHHTNVILIALTLLFWVQAILILWLEIAVQLDFHGIVRACQMIFYCSKVNRLPECPRWREMMSFTVIEGTSSHYCRGYRNQWNYGLIYWHFMLFFRWEMQHAIGNFASQNLIQVQQKSKTEKAENNSNMLKIVRLRYEMQL